MSYYKTNDIIIQHGGFIFQVLLFICCAAASLLVSCASCSWPVDLDNFAGGTFKSIKFNPFGDFFKKMGIDFGKIFKI